MILLRYLALEGLCLMSNSEFSVDAVRKHQETVVGALKVSRPESFKVFGYSIRVLILK